MITFRPHIKKIHFCTICGNRIPFNSNKRVMCGKESCRIEYFKRVRAKIKGRG